MTPQELDQFAQTVSAFKDTVWAEKREIKKALKKTTMLTWTLESLYEDLEKVEQTLVLVKEEQAKPPEK